MKFRVLRCAMGIYRVLNVLCWLLALLVESKNSLLQQPGPKKFKLSKIELTYRAKKFKVPPFTI